MHACMHACMHAPCIYTYIYKSMHDACMHLFLSHVTSQPFGCLAGVLDVLYLAHLAELAYQVGFCVNGPIERTSVAVVCLCLPD